MKNRLIDMWFDLPRQHVNTYLMEHLLKQRSRIEEILYVRYGYDIALKFPFNI